MLGACAKTIGPSAWLRLQGLGYGDPRLPHDRASTCATKLCPFSTPPPHQKKEKESLQTIDNKESPFGILSTPQPYLANSVRLNKTFHTHLHTIPKHVSMLTPQGPEMLVLSNARAQQREQVGFLRRALLRELRRLTGQSGTDAIRNRSGGQNKDFNQSLAAERLRPKTSRRPSHTRPSGRQEGDPFKKQTIPPQPSKASKAPLRPFGPFGLSRPHSARSWMQSLDLGLNGLDGLRVSDRSSTITYLLARAPLPEELAGRFGVPGLGLVEFWGLGLGFREVYPQHDTLLQARCNTVFPQNSFVAHADLRLSEEQ